ncbi:glycosyltransferase family 9 protein [Hippea jasoniae]|uniref:glycosyltransferase family 9 protein n=1 Tax=Hippea jasoniae TaxID=944479 RepID=UPI00054E0655|nr:glycosyltransferase family 9 protein [Hippea jasoniae]
MKILVIQLRQLGDVLLSSSIPRAIKTVYPQVKVDFLTSKAAKDILTLNPYIDNLITLKNGFLEEAKAWITIRKQKYDAILDLQRTARSQRITLFSNAKIRAAFFKKGTNLFYNTLIQQTFKDYTTFERLEILKAVGIENPPKFMPELYFNQKDKAFILNYLQSKNIKNYFVVSPTARKTHKMWSAEEFGKLSKKIAETFKLTPIIIYGSDKEKPIASICRKFSGGILIEKPFTIKQTAALIKDAFCVVGNDSFVCHIGVSQKTKTAVIGGPTGGWFLENDKTKVFYKGLDCQPCNNPKNCPYNLKCYRDLKHTEIADRVIEFLSN